MMHRERRWWRAAWPSSAWRNWPLGVSRSLRKILKRFSSSVSVVALQEWMAWWIRLVSSVKGTCLRFWVCELQRARRAARSAGVSLALILNMVWALRLGMTNFASEDERQGTRWPGIFIRSVCSLLRDCFNRGIGANNRIERSGIVLLNKGAVVSDKLALKCQDRSLLITPEYNQLSKTRQYVRHMSKDKATRWILLEY